MNQNGVQRGRKDPHAATPAASRPVEQVGSADGDFWDLRLYVGGETPSAKRALANLTQACESHLRGHYTIEVIDLLVNPRLATDNQIVALPTLVRRLPPPIKKVIGDLSDIERMLVGLELRAGEVPR